MMVAVLSLPYWKFSKGKYLALRQVATTKNSPVTVLPSLSMHPTKECIHTFPQTSFCLESLPSCQAAELSQLRQASRRCSAGGAVQIPLQNTPHAGINLVFAEKKHEVMSRGGSAQNKHKLVCLLVNL